MRYKPMAPQNGLDRESPLSIVTRALKFHRKNNHIGLWHCDTREQQKAIDQSIAILQNRAAARILEQRKQQQQSFGTEQQHESQNRGSSRVSYTDRQPHLLWSTSGWTASE
jgi:hypothetical protein